MRSNPSYQSRPEWLNSQTPAFALWRRATSRRFFGILATLLFLIMVGQAVAGVISIHAAESESSLSARLHLPRAQQDALPVIIIVPDARQQEMRHERYVEHLLAGGFAVLVPQDQPVEMGWLLDAARQNPILDGGRIGLLSFGTGAALTPEIGRLPRALLYPGCGQLAFPRETAPLLLIHGDADPANPALACAALAQGWEESGAAVTHYALQGVAHAWGSDLPDSIAHLLPQMPRMVHGIALRSDEAATEQAADMVAQFFLELFR